MSEQEDSHHLWWAAEDMPPRDVPRLAFLIDGRMTMLEMSLAFLCARQSIYITAWGLSPEILLVRGKHKCAGSEGTPEQEELLSWLRAKGLAEEELRFWQDCQELSITSVLSRVVEKGVDVRVLLWDTYTLPFQSNPNPKKVQEMLESIGIRCLLDDSHLGLLNHPLEAHHQKTAVIDGRLAFVGGLDLMMENSGEYDRWDTKGHPFHSPLRLGKDGRMPHSWHDAHVLLEGPAALDVELNFRQRWNAVVSLHEMPASLILPEISAPPPTRQRRLTRLPGTGDSTLLQVTRTIPKGSYRFAQEDGITTILESYKRAFARAKRFIYIENQYLWRQTFLGFENPALGAPHPVMDELFHTLADALARGVIVTLLLPDNPNVGREFTDEGINYLWELAPHAVSTGALQALTLASSLHEEGQSLYRSIYVHAKLAIVDDTWVTVGSANLNNRGMYDDTEMNVAIIQPELVRRLRIFLMAEHLGLCNEDELFQLIDTLGQVHLSRSGEESQHMRNLKRWFLQRQHPGGLTSPKQLRDNIKILWQEIEASIGDPYKGLALLTQQARENFQAIKAGQRLVGHVLPYIPHNRAQDYGVEVSAANGWLDTLSNPQEQNASMA
ncbi:MAG TPA: phospholipase D family protein [Ktedonobacteraceae bacterium]